MTTDAIAFFRDRFGITREDVERLLGPPADCRPEGPCQYPTQRRNAAGLTLGLEVDYRVHNVDRTETVVTGRLESLRFGPRAP